MPLEKTEDLPYSFDEVWDTTLIVLQRARWNVTRASKETGGIEVHVVMDPVTWTETFYVNMTEIDSDTTRVLVGKIGLAQPLDWGIARQYIDSFFAKLDTTLKETQSG